MAEFVQTHCRITITCELDAASLFLPHAYWPGLREKHEKFANCSGRMDIGS